MWKCGTLSCSLTLESSELIFRTSTGPAVTNRAYLVHYHRQIVDELTESADLETYELDGVRSNKDSRKAFRRNWINTFYNIS